LSNLSDFDPAVDEVAWSEMLPLDQYILARTAELDAKVREAYDGFEFHRAYQALNEFTNTDLSALYADVVKDRLYTLAPKSLGRRSAQTAMWRICEAMTRLIAPILSFTADEVWQYLPKMEGRAESVHLALFPAVAEIVPGAIAGLEADWETLLAVRASVMVELERLRLSKAIGKSLEASVHLTAPEGSQEALLLTRYENSLAEFFNVSQVSVELLDANAYGKIGASLADGAKCGRCWRVVPDVGADARWPVVCARCAEALDAIGFAPMQGEVA